MLRESPADGARNVALLLVHRAGVRLSARTTLDGGSRCQPPAPAAKAAPCWLKLMERKRIGHCSELPASIPRFDELIAGFVSST